MVEIGDQGFVAPIPGGRWAFVPVSEAEVGDEGILVPIAGGRWLAVPQYALAVGDPALAMPEAGGIGTAAIHWRAVAATPIPTAWETVVPAGIGRQPICCDRISATSVVVGTGGIYGPHIYRSDDSGETWSGPDQILTEGGTAGIYKLHDICGTHDMDGNYLIVGAAYEDHASHCRVWKYNPATGKHTYMESSTLEYNDLYQFVRVASGYFLHAAGHGFPLAHGYFSADGANWIACGAYTGYDSDWGRATCTGGDSIVYGDSVLVDRGGSINYSDDGGATWATASAEVIGAPIDFGAWGGGQCATVGTTPDGECVHLISDDYGRSWSVYSIDESLQYGRSWYWVSTGSGYVARVPQGAGSVAYESFDRGATWTETPVAPAAHSHSCEGVALPSGIIIFPLWDNITEEFSVYRGLP